MVATINPSATMSRIFRYISRYLGALKALSVYLLRFLGFDLAIEELSQFYRVSRAA